MFKSPLFFAISILVTLVSCITTAKAESSSLELSFVLPPVEEITTTEDSLVRSNNNLNSSIAAAVSTEQAAQQSQLPLENHFESLESEYGSLETLSRPQESLRAISEQLENVEPDSAKLDDIGIQFHKDVLDWPVEKPAEKPHESNPTQEATYSNMLHLVEAGRAAVEVAAANGAETEKANAATDRNLNTDSQLSKIEDWIFEGGSKSLVAHTVGSAEGTRHWSGKRTPAYYGHTDPGNGVWNLGTFSYQHEASSPEDADYRQLKRLKTQGHQLKQQALERGIQLTLQEKLNGLDLANQAPIAALGEGGYIDRLAQAYRLQLSGDEAIAWARTRAYIDPDTKTWNAPGLGNNLYSISKDQERRMAAIEQALRAYNQVNQDTSALASLDSIRLEDAGIEEDPELESAALSSFRKERQTLGTPSFGTVAEAFKRSASDTTERYAHDEPTSLSAEAINFDLPSLSSAGEALANHSLGDEDKEAASASGSDSVAPVVEQAVVEQAELIENRAQIESNVQTENQTISSTRSSQPADDTSTNGISAIALTFSSNPTTLQTEATDVESARAYLEDHHLEEHHPGSYENDSAGSKKVDRESLPQLTLGNLLDGVSNQKTEDELKRLVSPKRDLEQFYEHLSQPALLRTEDRIVQQQ